MDNFETSEKNKNQINSLLDEYTDCQGIIDHYDGMRWTVGTIVIFSSLGLCALSLGLKLFNAILLATFPIALLVIWYHYALHVNPNILPGISRCQQIEQELEKVNFSIKQHKGGYLTKNYATKLKGTKITQWIFSLNIIMWIACISKKIQGELSLVHSLIFATFSLVALYFFVKWFEKYHLDKNTNVFTN